MLKGTFGVTTLLPLLLVLCASCSDPYSGDLGKERAKHTTKLHKKGPSPQEAGPVGAPPAGVKAITYDSGSLKLKAWISDIPSGAKKRPAVVFCHGGFAFGDGDWEQAQPFIKAGYIVMMPMLRGENGNPGNFEMFYGEVDDAIAAGKFLTLLSGVDRTRVFIAGHSAGGTIAALSAAMPSPFKAAAAYGATTDMDSFLNPKSEFRFMAPFDPTDKNERQLRSILSYIKTIQCPLYFFAGAGDAYARQQMRNLDTLATNAGKTCQNFEVGGDHFTSVTESIERSVELFNKVGGK